MGYRILSFPWETVRATSTSRRGRALGRAGPHRYRGRGPRSLSPPAVSDRSGGWAGPGPAVRTKRAGGRTLTRAGVGAGRGGARQGTLTQQQYILPRGELGARAGGDLAKDAGPSGEQRRTLRPGTGARGRDGPGLGALGRGLLRTQWPRHGIPRCPQGRECQWGPREGWGRYQRFCPSSSSPAAAPPLPDVSSLAKGPPV